MLVRIRAIGNRMWEDIRNLKLEMSKSESLPIFLISKESASKALVPFCPTQFHKREKENVFPA